MSIGDILDATFKLYARNFLAFMMIAIVPYILVAFIESFEAPAAAAPGQRPPLNTMAFLATLITFMIAMPICQGALTFHISKSFLGTPISVGEALKLGLSRAFPLVIAGILYGFAVMFGLVLLVVPGIIFALWFMLYAPALILERTSPTQSLSRSKALMSGNLGKGFLLSLVVFLMSAIIGLPIEFLKAMAGETLDASMRMPARFALGLIGVLALPIQTAPGILLYYDLRTRKEGFDLEHLASSMGQEGSQASSDDGTQVSS